MESAINTQIPQQTLPDLTKQERLKKIISNISDNKATKFL